jgi:serine/threonine-protein kinase
MPEAPPKIGKYEILRQIGRGAMGVVYEARDPDLDRTIALKVIRLSLPDDEVDTFEKRFLREARIAAKLQHPGIVVVHGVGRDEPSGTLYIALELLRGRTLANLARDGPLDWPLVLRLTAQVAHALHHAHLQGVVHRDIKPSNVMVLPSGDTKVMDFGIARVENARLTTTSGFLGTPLYTAPEQARVEEVDARADLFSLASVAYTLLTGRAAFDAPTIPAMLHRVVYVDPVPPSRLVEQLPPDLERVLSRAMAKEPGERHPTAEAFAEDLEDVLAGRPPRHTAEEEMVVVEEPESPLVALVAEVGAPPSPDPSSPPVSAMPALDASLVPAGRRSRRALIAGALVLAALALVYFGLKAARPRRPPAITQAPQAASSAPRRAAPRPVPPTPVPPQAPGLPGRLRIHFDHPLRSGTLRVFVDDQVVAEERLSGQQRSMALVFKVHEGTFREEFDVSPGVHEVRVEVRWDDNLKRESIVGHFRPDVTRTLEASLGRLRKDLSLEWK